MRVSAPERRTKTPRPGDELLGVGFLLAGAGGLRVADDGGRARVEGPLEAELRARRRSPGARMERLGKERKRAMS